MANYVLWSVNAIVTMKRKFAVHLVKMLTGAQSSQHVSQKERTCTMKSAQVSVLNLVNTMKFHASNLMTQIMAVLIQTIVKQNKLIILENSVISNNVNLCVIIHNIFVKETFDTTAATQACKLQIGPSKN